MKLISLVGSLLSLLVLSSAVSAQTASVSGDIRGTISDPSGAVLPKVTVTAASAWILERSLAEDQTTP